MSKFNKISSTSHPTLTRAVIKQLDGKESLIDVNNHGAMSGYCGFTYYKDTVTFFEKHRKEILSLLEEDAESFGEDPASIVMQFRCLNLSRSDRDEWRTYQGAVSRLLYGTKKVDWDRPDEIMVANSLAWYGLETVAREMVIE